MRVKTFILATSAVAITRANIATNMTVGRITPLPSHRFASIIKEFCFFSSMSWSCLPPPPHGIVNKAKQNKSKSLGGGSLAQAGAISSAVPTSKAAALTATGVVFMKSSPTVS